MYEPVLPEPFTFFDPGHLSDGELTLVLRELLPGDPARGYAPAYKFAMRIPGVLEDIGQIDIRIGNPPSIVLYVGHIGYGVKPAYRGHNYALRACRLLLPLARRHGLKELVITCNPDNMPSIRTIEKLGARYVETLDVPPGNELHARGETRKRRYVLDLQEGVGRRDEARGIAETTTQ